MNSFDAPLLVVAEIFREALVRSTGRALFVSPHFPQGSRLKGRFEVRNSKGKIKRLEDAELVLPPPFFRMASRIGWPTEITRIETRQLGRITLWPLALFLELQVGSRWNGFSGKPMAAWPDNLVVLAECEADPVALKSDEENSPVILASRCDEGLCATREIAPCFADFLMFLSEEIHSGAVVSLVSAEDFF